jgi:hypothetical protein
LGLIDNYNISAASKPLKGENMFFYSKEETQDIFIGLIRQFRSWSKEGDDAIAQEVLRHLDDLTPNQIIKLEKLLAIKTNNEGGETRKAITAVVEQRYHRKSLLVSFLFTLYFSDLTNLAMALNVRSSIFYKILTIRIF